MDAHVKVKDLIEMLQKQPQDSVVFMIATGYAYPVDSVSFNNTIDKTEIRGTGDRIKYNREFSPVPANDSRYIL
jgi:hypothetical protein